MIKTGDNVIARVRQTIYANVDMNNVCHHTLGVTLANESKGLVIARVLGNDSFPTKFLISWNGPVMIYAGPVKGEAYCWMHDYEIMLDPSV